VFCVWHGDKIQEYVNNSKWPSILSVRCIQSTSCLSAGDALRELDTMNIIRSDPFVLISGDVISNINLKEAIAFHKRKRKEDINNVMTMVLKEVQTTAGLKPVLDDLVVAMDRSSSQIVLFENAYKKNNVKVSLELMAEHPKGLTFYTDLLDCNVDICSPELMVQFSDNFDYQVRIVRFTCVLSCLRCACIISDITLGRLDIVIQLSPLLSSYVTSLSLTIVTPIGTGHPPGLHPQRGGQLVPGQAHLRVPHPGGVSCLFAVLIADAFESGSQCVYCGLLRMNGSAQH
jgi:hypothetical protein